MLAVVAVEGVNKMNGILGSRMAESFRSRIRSTGGGIFLLLKRLVIGKPETLFVRHGEYLPNSMGSGLCAVVVFAYEWIFSRPNG
jgi:hypothetical protein